MVRVPTPAGDYAWTVVRHAEVRRSFDNPLLGRTHPHPERAPRVLETLVWDCMLQGHATEAADHGNMRALLGPFFSPSAMRVFRPRVQALVGLLLDRMEQAGSPADLHSSLSHPLPVRAVSELMGIPCGVGSELAAVCQGMFAPGNPELERLAAGRMLLTMTELVKTKIRSPDGKLLSRLLHARAGSPPEQVAALAGGVFFAAFVNTVRVLDLGVLLLLAHPSQKRALREDPRLLPGAREEILRATRTAEGAHPRYAHADIDIGGCPIPAGDLVILDLGGANHDPRCFAEPDLFDIKRKPNPHLSFGAGHWFCLGAPLARMELDIAFGELLRRFPSLRLAVPQDQIAAGLDELTGAPNCMPVEW